MARITGLADRSDGVAVELDGTPWRVLPTEVVVRAGVREGRELDRQTLRAVRHELRRQEALGIAARVLHRRDVSRTALDHRLRAAGVATSVRADALDALERAGLVDDARLAAGRAAALAARGYGDAAIRADLGRTGVAAAVAEAAVASLESETERALRIVAQRGRSTRTARFLARRGFGEDALEATVGATVANEA